MTPRGPGPQRRTGRAVSAWRVLILLAGSLCGTRAVAQEFAFATDSEAGFRRLMQLVQDGRAGDDVVNANIGIDRTTVRVELVTRSSSRRALTLSAPGGPGRWRSRYFVVDVGAGAGPADAERLSRLLDEAFDHEPYVLVWHGWNDPRPETPPEPLGQAWHRAGLRGFCDAFLIRSLRPVGRGFIVTMIALNAIAVLACLALLLAGAGTREALARGHRKKKETA